MARFKFKKPEGAKGEGEQTTSEKPDKGKAGPGKSKGAEKAARRYAKKEVRKGD